MSSRALREVERLLGPGPAKCESPRNAESKRKAKQRFRAILAELGLDKDEEKQREAARLLNVSEATLRGWLHPDDLQRNPPQWAIDELGSEALRIAAYAFARAVNDSIPPSGTDG